MKYPNLHSWLLHFPNTCTLFSANFDFPLFQIPSPTIGHSPIPLYPSLLFHNFYNPPSAPAASRRSRFIVFYGCFVFICTVWSVGRNTSFILCSLPRDRPSEWLMKTICGLFACIFRAGTREREREREKKALARRDFKIFWSTNNTQ